MLIPIPRHEVPERYVPDVVSVDMKEHARIAAFLSVPNWVCPKCGTTVSGHTPCCAYCRQRLNKETCR